MTLSLYLDSSFSLAAGQLQGLQACGVQPNNSQSLKAFLGLKIIFIGYTSNLRSPDVLKGYLVSSPLQEQLYEAE